MVVVVLFILVFEYTFHRVHHAIHGDNRVGVEDGLVEISAKQQADVADDQLVGCRLCRTLLAHELTAPDDEPANDT